MPQISIIVPIYKVDQYLQRCVDSILVQTFTDYELILIDDGSPDQSGQIDDEYAVQDDRMLSIHHKNGGVSSARNAGLDIARGEYIVFADPDDYVLPKYLEELFHPEYDFVCQTVVKVDENDQILKKVDLPEYSFSNPTADDITELLNNSTLNYPHCKCYKSALIQKNGLRFNTKISLAEDVLFSTQYMKMISSVIVENVSNYRYVRYNSRSTLDGKRTQERIRMIIQAYHLVSEAISDELDIQRKVFLRKATIAYYVFLNDSYRAFPARDIIHRLSCLWYLTEDEDFHSVLKSGISYGFSDELSAAIQSGKKSKVTLEYIHYCLYLLKKNTPPLIHE